uniref:RdRp catalytic domain-containing protein n=1 Tax=Trichuris muris TaxID=70415 RepID=A0A5S6R604_TRIMR
MVLEMRLYFCVADLNLAEVISKYLPQQTMTSTEVDLTTRLFTIADACLHRHKAVPVIINIDFEKWNLRWRQTTTEGVFRVIDDLFGTPGPYTFSNEFFKRSKFYLVSQYGVPASVNDANKLMPPESSAMWFNDESGKEGTRQKGWTTTWMLMKPSPRCCMLSYQLGFQVLSPAKETTKSSWRHFLLLMT